MDPRRFDELARRFAGALSRRAVIRWSAGAGFLASLGVESAAGKRKGKRKRKAKAKSCTPNGKVCGRDKKLPSCATCCSGFNVTSRSKKSTCACRPDGASCTGDDQCCAGVCDQRVCGAFS